MINERKQSAPFYILVSVSLYLAVSRSVELYTLRLQTWALLRCSAPPEMNMCLSINKLWQQNRNCPQFTVMQGPFKFNNPTVTSTHFYSWHISDIYHSEYPICTFISLITSDASGPLWEQSCGHEDTASCPEQLFCVWTLLPDPLASTDSVLAGHGTFFIARSKVLFHSLFIRAIEKRMHIYFFTYTTQGSYHNNQQCIKFTVSASLQYL